MAIEIIIFIDFRKNSDKLNYMSKNKTKKTYLYPVKVESHKEGGYQAKCPILQGAWADGETIEEAVANLRDVIRLILKYREERERKNFISLTFLDIRVKLLNEKL